MGERRGGVEWHTEKSDKAHSYEDNINGKRQEQKAP